MGLLDDIAQSYQGGSILDDIASQYEEPSAPQQVDVWQPGYEPVQMPSPKADYGVSIIDDIAKSYQPPITPEQKYLEQPGWKRAIGALPPGPGTFLQFVTGAEPAPVSRAAARTWGVETPEVGKPIVEGYKQVTKAPLQFGQMISDVFQNEYDKDGTLRKLSEAGILQTDEAYQLRKENKPGIIKYMEDVLGMAPQIATQYAAHYLGGKPATMAWMGVQIAGPYYEQLVSEGVSPRKAFVAAIANASAQARLEAVQLSFVFDKLGGKKLATALIEGAATEWATEWLQKYPELLTTLWAKNEKLTLENIIEATKEGAYEGMVAAPFGGLGGAAAPRRAAPKRVDPTQATDMLTGETEPAPEQVKTREDAEDLLNRVNIGLANEMVRRDEEDAAIMAEMQAPIIPEETPMLPPEAIEEPPTVTGIPEEETRQAVKEFEVVERQKREAALPELPEEAIEALPEKRVAKPEKKERLRPVTAPKGRLGEPLRGVAREKAEYQKELKAAEAVTAKPTPAQIEAGTYKKGRVKIHGFEGVIETPKGQERLPGVKVKHPVGYIRRVEGVDGDQLDVIFGPEGETTNIFVVDQGTKKTGRFDEHKVMMGFKNTAQAKLAHRTTYGTKYSALSVVEMTPAEFKKWVSSGKVNKPVSEQPPITEMEWLQKPELRPQGYITKKWLPQATGKYAQETNRRIVAEYRQWLKNMGYRKPAPTVAYEKQVAAKRVDKRPAPIRAMEELILEEQKKVQDYEDRTGKKVGWLEKKIKAGDIKEPKKLTADQKLAVTVAESFGVDMSFYTGPSFSASGMFIPGPNTIAMWAGSEKPALFVLMHEMTHNMQEEAPDLYRGLRKFLWNNKSEPDFRAYAKALNSARMADGQDPMPLNPYLIENRGKTTVFDEYMAEGVAHNAFKKTFWNKMQKKNPGLFGKMVNYITDFMHNLRAKISKTQTQRLKFFNDIDGMVMDQIADAMNKFAERPIRATQLRRKVAAAQKERIASAAILYDGKAYTGINHGEAWDKAERRLKKEINVTDKEFQGDGFLTSDGRYVDREEALRIATEVDQLNKEEKSVLGEAAKRERRRGYLISEVVKMQKEDFLRIRNTVLESNLWPAIRRKSTGKIYKTKDRFSTHHEIMDSFKIKAPFSDNFETDQRKMEYQYGFMSGDRFLFRDEASTALGIQERLPELGSEFFKKEEDLLWREETFKKIKKAKFQKEIQFPAEIPRQTVKKTSRPNGQIGTPLGNKLYWMLPEMIDDAVVKKSKKAPHLQVRDFFRVRKLWMGIEITPEVSKTFMGQVKKYTQDKAFKKKYDEIRDFREGVASGAISYGSERFNEMLEKYSSEDLGITSIKHRTRFPYTKTQLYGPVDEVDVKEIIKKEHILLGEIEIEVYMDPETGMAIVDGPLFSEDRGTRLAEIEAIVKKNKFAVEWYEKEWHEFMMRWKDKVDPETLVKYIKLQGIFSSQRSPQENQLVFSNVVKVLEKGERDLIVGKLKDGGDGLMDGTELYKVNQVWQGLDTPTTLDEFIEYFGPKVGPYIYTGLMPHQMDAVVIDRHMGKPWGYNLMWTHNGNYANMARPPEVIAEVAGDIIEVAKRTGVSVGGVQAAIWFDIRKADVGAASYREAAQIKPDDYMPSVMYEATAPEFIAAGVHYKKTTLGEGDYVYGATEDGTIRFNSYSQDEVGMRIEASTKRNPYARLVYAYEAKPGFRPEPMVSTGRMAHIIDFKRSRIYNGIEDLARFWKTAEQRVAMDKNVQPGMTKHAMTNAFANLIKKTGSYDGFLYKQGNNNVIAMFEEAAIKQGPENVTLALSDVVESVERLPQQMGEISKLVGDRKKQVLYKLKNMARKYTGLTISEVSPTVARFGDATTGSFEIGAMVRVEGPRQVAEALGAEWGTANAQNYVYAITPVGPESKKSPNGFLYSFPLKREFSEMTPENMKKIEEVIKKHDVRDINIGMRERSGNLFMERFFSDYDESITEEDIDKFVDLMGEIAAPTAKLDRVPAYSEMLEPGNYESKIKEHLGEKHGGEVYAEAEKTRRGYVDLLTKRQAAREAKEERDRIRGQDAGDKLYPANRKRPGDEPKFQKELEEIKGDQISPEDYAPLFYSDMVRYIESKKFQEGQPSKVKAFLEQQLKSKAQPFKQEEYDWSMLPDWLGSLPDFITKDDGTRVKNKITRERILDFIESNQIRLIEIRRRSESDRPIGDGIEEEVGLPEGIRIDPETMEVEVSDELIEEAIMETEWIQESYIEAEMDYYRVQNISEEYPLLEEERPDEDGVMITWYSPDPNWPDEIVKVFNESMEQEGFDQLDADIQEEIYAWWGDAHYLTDSDGEMFVDELTYNDLASQMGIEQDISDRAYESWEYADSDYLISSYGDIIEEQIIENFSDEIEAAKQRIEQQRVFDFGIDDDEVTDLTEEDVLKPLEWQSWKPVEYMKSGWYTPGGVDYREVQVIIKNPSEYTSEGAAKIEDGLDEIEKNISRSKFHIAKFKQSIADGVVMELAGMGAGKEELANRPGEIFKHIYKRDWPSFIVNLVGYTAPAVSVDESAEKLYRKYADYSFRGGPLSHYIKKLLRNFYTATKEDSGFFEKMFEASNALRGVDNIGEELDFIRSAAHLGYDDTINRNIRESVSEATANLKIVKDTGVSHLSLELIGDYLKQLDEISERTNRLYNKYKGEISRPSEVTFDAPHFSPGKDMLYHFRFDTRYIRQPAKDKLKPGIEFKPGAQEGVVNIYQDEELVGMMKEEDARKLHGEEETKAKILFVQEIQSDWVQQGIKKGWMFEYRGPEKERQRITAAAESLENRAQEISNERPAILSKIEYFEREINDAQKTIDYEENQSEPNKRRIEWAKAERKRLYKEGELAQVEKKMSEKLYDSLMKKAGDLRSIIGEGEIWDVPFKSTWHMNAIKRLVRFAAERGYDAIAMTSGEHQAQRWSGALRDVKALRYFKDEKALRAYGSNDELLTEKIGVEENEIEDYVGSKTARELLDQPGDVKHYQGEIKIGNRFLRAFYNKKLPRDINKIFNKKKWGNAKLTPGVMYLDENNELQELKEIKGSGVKWQIIEKVGQVGVRVIAEHNSKERALNDPAFTAKTAIRRVGHKIAEKDMVFSMPITQKMKRKALTEGFPLFNKDLKVEPEADAKKIIEKKIGPAGRSLKEKIRDAGQDIKENWRTRMVDRLYPIKKWMGEGKAYMLARGIPGIQSSLNAMMVHGKLRFDESGALTTDTVKEGFLKWYDKLGKDADKFFYWVVAKRAQALKAEDREFLFSNSDINKILKWVGPKPTDAPYRSWGEMNSDFKLWNKSVLDIAQQSGLIDKEFRDYMASQGYYVPFYRVLQDEDSRVQFLGKKMRPKEISAQIKKLRGSEKPMGDPLENMLRNWSHLLSESVQNVARRTAYAYAKNNKLVAGYDEDGKEIPLVEPVSWADTVTFKKAGKEKGAPTFIHKKEGVPILQFKAAGKSVFFKVNDPELFNALGQMDVPGFDNFVMKAMQIGKRGLTFGATFGPAFRVKNFLRDTLHTFQISKGFIPLWDSIAGAYKVFTQSEDYVKFMASGMAFGGSYLRESDPSSYKKFVDKIAKREGNIAKKYIIDTPAKALKLWNELGEAFENAARVQLYSKMIKRGHSHLEAGFAARDLMDFNMSGSGAATRFLIGTVPFLNARVQGLYKMGRAAYEQPGSFFAKSASIALVSLALWWLNSDDDRYKELEDFEKFAWYHFWIGDKHYRIPKPFETGVLFSTSVEASADVIKGNEEASHIMDYITHATLETLAFNPTPQVAKPIIEQIANKNMFTGRPIESLAMQRRTPGERWDPWDSESMRLLGQKLGVSPKRAQALVRGYLSTFGMFLIGGADMMTRWLADFPERPTKRVDDYMLVGSFVRQADNPRYTKYMSEFYDAMNNANELAGDVAHFKRTGEFDKARELTRKHKNIFSYRKALNKTYKKLSDLSAKIKGTWLRTDLDADEKKKRIDKYTQQRNDLVRKVYNAYLKGD